MKSKFTTAKLQHQPIIQKKIKNKIIGASNSPPKRKKTKFIIEDVPSPPKQPRNSPPKRKKTKFIIEDVPSPPKQPRNSPPKRKKTKFIIEDVPSPPKQPRNSSISSMSASALPSSPPTMCCSCHNIISVHTITKCVWCQLYYHLEKCVSHNAKERNKRN